MAAAAKDDHRNPLVTRAWRRLRASFVEREIIVRSRGRTRFVAISGAAQLALVIGMAVLAGGGVVAAVGFKVEARRVAARDAAIAASGSAQRQLLVQLDEHQESMTLIAHELQEKQRVLRQLFEENEALKSDLVTTEERLRMTEAERQRVADGRAAIRRQMARLETEMQGMSGENGALSRHLDGLRRQIDSLQARNADLARERASHERRIVSLDSQLVQALGRVGELEADARATQAELARTQRERDAAAFARQELVARLGEVEGRLAASEDLHRRTVQRYAEQTLSSILQVEELVGRTGVKIETLLPGAGLIPGPRKRGGQGGPFVPWQPRGGAPPTLEELGHTLSERVDRLELLRDLVGALPLRVPFEDATVMSGFGYRRDPVSGAAAMHSGLDLGGPMRAEIRPTAPGHVVFAGWQGEYGRVVDIDHGFGIRTRYAHLSKTLVEAGDAVAVGDRIGLLGSSGRTTGPHLHYEVLIKGKNVDPAKFLKAGNHVLQGR